MCTGTPAYYELNNVDQWGGRVGGPMRGGRYGGGGVGRVHFSPVKTGHGQSQRTTFTSTHDPESPAICAYSHIVWG